MAGILILTLQDRHNLREVAVVARAQGSLDDLGSVLPRDPILGESRVEAQTIDETSRLLSVHGADKCIAFVAHSPLD